MQGDFFTLLGRAISHERLESYRRKGAEIDGLNLYAHYAWNIALSESLYPALQGLEVSLRNGIHGAATERFNAENWFADESGFLLPPEQDSVRKAKGTLIKCGKQPEAAGVIAELNFGFWTSLFDVRYEQKLWPWLLKPVFPYMPRSIRTRKTLSKRLNRIRLLRNRVFHHEPVWYWGDLAQQHEELLEAIAWLNPSMKDFIITLDRFHEVHGNGAEKHRVQLEKLTRPTGE